MKARRKWPVPRRGSRDEAMPLIEEYHPYKSMGNVGEVWVCGYPVQAAWLWLPPPPNAAKAVSPGEPSGALALSRMVATPFAERGWHLSKPLRWLMRHGIDRTRYPVLVTYSDAGEGHCGNVYKCSGWQRDGARDSPKYVGADGQRVSAYRNGRFELAEGLTLKEVSSITRWTHRVCEPGEEGEYMRDHGWERVPTGKRWRSGSLAMKWVKWGAAKAKQATFWGPM